MKESELFGLMLNPTLFSLFKNNYQDVLLAYNKDNPMYAVINALNEIDSAENITETLVDIKLTSNGINGIIRDDIINTYKKSVSMNVEEFASIIEWFKGFVGKQKLKDIISKKGNDALAVIEEIKKIDITDEESILNDKEIYQEDNFGTLDVKQADEEAGVVIKSSFSLVNDNTPKGGYFTGQIVAVCGPPSCFVGSTKVMTLDGHYKTMKELCESKSRNIPVYSVNPDNGEPEVVYAEECIKTKEVLELCEVELDNGDIERCTIDHKWLTVDEGYLEAKDLKPNTRLMPLHRKLSCHPSNYHGSKKCYESIYTTIDKGQYNEYTHRSVGKLLNNKLCSKSGNHVHHNSRNPDGSFDSLNNLPENIIVMTHSEHNKLHLNERWKLNYDKMKDISINNLPEYRSDVTIDLIKNSVIKNNKFDEYMLSDEFNCSRSLILSRIYDKYSDLREFTESCGLEYNRNAYDKISMDKLVELAKKHNTYKIDYISNIEEIPINLLRYTRNINFGSSSKFAKYLGMRYDTGNWSKRWEGINIIDLKEFMMSVGPECYWKDLISYYGKSRSCIQKYLKSQNYTIGKLYKEVFTNESDSIKVTKELLIELAIKYNTYKDSVISEKSGLSYDKIFNCRKSNFGTLKEFAEYLNMEYRKRSSWLDLNELKSLMISIGPKVSTKDIINYYSKSISALEYGLSKLGTSFTSLKLELFDTDSDVVSYSNHSVKSIKIIKLDSPEPVYDLINSGPYHNFVIKVDDNSDHEDSGVVVSNSGDLFA